MRGLRPPHSFMRPPPTHDAGSVSRLRHQRLRQAEQRRPQNTRVPEGIIPQKRRAFRLVSDRRSARRTIPFRMEADACTPRSAVRSGKRPEGMAPQASTSPWSPSGNLGLPDRPSLHALLMEAIWLTLTLAEPGLSAAAAIRCPLQTTILRSPASRAIHPHASLWAVV